MGGPSEAHRSATVDGEAMATQNNKKKHGKRSDRKGEQGANMAQDHVDYQAHFPWSHDVSIAHADR